MQTILECLAAHAELRPGKPFLIAWEGNSYRIMTYGDLLAESLAIAGTLATYQRGSVVFIVLRQTVDFCPAFLGCMLAGLVPSFLPFPSPKQDPELYFSSHEALFARVKPACMITYVELMDALRDVLPLGTPLLDIDPLYRKTAPTKGSILPDPDRTALLQFSSGTTGLKKGVALSFKQIASQVSAYAPVAELSVESVVVSWLPLYHDMGLFTGFLIPLTIGASVVCMDPFEWVRSPSLLLTLIATFRGTQVWLPNFAFQHILAAVEPDEQFDLSSLRQIISCSEVVKPEVVQRFADRFSTNGLDAARLKACYAMAEASFAVAQTSAGGAASFNFASTDLALGKRPRLAEDDAAETCVSLTSNGPALPSVEIAIAVAFERETGPFTSVGEIVLRGEYLFECYYGEPNASAKALRDGWYYTGDVGFMYRGELFICGRLKELIIVHGRNYYCHDIEAIASGVRGVVPGRVVAIGEVSESSASEELLLIAELEDNDPDVQDDVRRALKKAVFHHLELTPRQIAFVPRGWLVKTTSGKLSRSENLVRLRRCFIEENACNTKLAS